MKKRVDTLISVLLVAIVAWFLLSWGEVLRHQANSQLNYSQYNLFIALSELAKQLKVKALVYTPLS